MRAPALLVLLCVAAGVAACTPESVRSLPENLRIAADDRLVGTWRARVLGNDHVAVVTRGDAGTLDVVLRTHAAGRDTPGDVVETRHRLFFFDLDGTRLIAERGPGFVDRAPVYRIAAYDIAADGAVTLRFTSEREILRWVLPLKLAGKARSTDPLFRDVLIVARPENIVAVLRSIEPARMFDVVFGPFTRR